MKQFFITSLLLSLNISLVFSQGEQEIVRCGTDEYHAEQMQNPEYAEKFQAKIESVRNYLDQQDGSRSDCEEVLLIPVAVHFQDVGLSEDCALDMALDQVARLNADFAGTNDDIVNWEGLQPSVWPSISNKESCIQFCLATLNHPDGFGLSDGDYAVTMNETDGDNDPAWSGYLNFWVREVGGGTLGYSPLGGNGNGDGVVCTLSAFSSVSCDGNNINPTYNLGRTMTHEVGHYLLLEHPWGGGGCASTDEVADTPVTDAATFGCPEDDFVNCTNPVLWPTYMEYCDDQCLFMFSEDQVDRMEAYVNTSLENLLNNSVTTCQEAVCNDFEVSTEFMDESCPGNDGSITVVVEGGTEPYSFSISGGSNSQDNGDFENLSAGSYDVYVIDDEECDFATTIEITQETADVSLVSVEGEYCSDTTGYIEVMVNEAGAFQYKLEGVTEWQDIPIFDNLPSGDYTVSVRNSAGCSGTVQTTVENESDLDLRIEKLQPVNCPWFDNGAIAVSILGAEPPVSYSLNEGEPQENGVYEGLSVGAYSLHMADQAGCELTYDFEINRSYLALDDDCPCNLYIPTAITPDGDQLNEVFKTVASCPVSEYHLRIYDQWGDIIFETTDPDQVWEGGTDSRYFVKPGVYNYRVTYQWGEASDADIDVQSQSGTISVVR
jgi:gliding motility-associated-like protein